MYEGETGIDQKQLIIACEVKKKRLYINTASL
jgi:hypothetical protein